MVDFVTLCPCPSVAESLESFIVDNSNERIADTVREACKRLSIGRSRLYEEINERRLEARKVGRKTLILRSSQDQWLASLPVAPNCGKRR